MDTIYCLKKRYSTVVVNVDVVDFMPFVELYTKVKGSASIDCGIDSKGNVVVCLGVE